MKLAIVGAGLVGRLLAVTMARRDWQVTLLDADDERGTASCTWTGAGMLAPYCELERAETIIAELGLRSIALWPAILAGLAAPVTHYQRGSLMVAHGNDQAEMQRLRRAYDARLADPSVLRAVNAAELGELEPELAGRFRDGLFFGSEGQVDNRELLHALGETAKALGVTWHCGIKLPHVQGRELPLPGGPQSFDWVIDCRGLGAREDLPDLRGVRGELVYVHAPEVHLQRPIRLMHPRYPIYIVPRSQQRYVIGATAIESDDGGAATVRSLLELLSAAYTVHTGFAEARFLEASVSCRPAFPDNLPRLYQGPGLLRLNGLYRHGFLIGPALVEMAVAVLLGATPPTLMDQVLRPDGQR
jgi:glycine oxidase